MSNPAKTGRTQNETWSLAWQFARCELRQSVMRFRIFLAALMLGVAAIEANVVHIVQTQWIAGIDLDRIRTGTCLTHDGALH